MKSQVIGIVGSFVLATSLAAQGAVQNPPPGQTPPPAQQQVAEKQKGTEVSITGCVIQGSTPAIFIIDNAKVKPEDPNEKPVTYVLVAGTEDLMFKEHLNHEVKVTGEVERRTPPVAQPGQKVAEKDLLKFTTKGVTQVADRCTS
jgi:hypothetical protein